MKKKLLIGLMAALALGLVTAGSAMASNGISVGPPSLDVDLPEEGVSTAWIYISSNIDGEVHVGTENLPFTVEPDIFSVANGDEYKEVELTFHRDDTAESGNYPGKLTFLIYAGDNIAYGVKIKVNADVTGVVANATENPEASGEIAEITAAPQPPAANGEGGGINQQTFLLAMAAIVATVIAIVFGVRSRRKKTSD